MKIDDPKAFYEFFSSLNLPGIIAVIIIAALVVAYFTSTIVEKLFKSTQKKAKMILIISSTSAIVLCGVLLKVDADKAKKDLIIVNTIKSYLIGNNQKFKSFKGLRKNFI
jgi:ABC-type multidrug transport system permease subunit